MKYIWLLLFALPVQARLAPTTLDSIIKESDVVLEGAPIRLERTGSRAGKATLKVYRVWAGEFSAPEVSIEWRDEVHDQEVTDLGKDYVLFLKKTEAGYSGTQYGRSYWPIGGGRVTDPTRADLDGEGRQIMYEYPASMVTLTGAQKKSLLTRDKRPRIALRALRELVTTAKKKP